MQPFSNKSNIPKICAFDCHTDTCINIQNIFFLNAPIQKFMHHFTLNRLQSFIYNPPPPSLSLSLSLSLALKGEHSLNMAVLSKTYKYILYNKQSLKSRQHSSLVSIEIPSITISLFSIFVNTSVNSQ